LLLLVIVVAVAMLLVLAQFRYPSENRTATVPLAGPIERLAARATFEELSLIMADLTARVQGDLAVITITRLPAAPVAARRGGPPPEPEPIERRLVPALRVDSDLAVAYLPDGFEVVETPGVVRATGDPERGLVLVHVDPRAFTAVGPVAPAIGGPGYIAVFEGARGGPAARPVFLGRVDSFGDDRWSVPLLAVGGNPEVRAGMFLYTLDGRLVGMTVPDEVGVAIVRVPALLTAVEALRLQ